MALFADLAKLADELAHEPSRLKKRAAIAEAIAAVHIAAPESEDAGLFALYLAGMPFAEADPRKLNAGGSLLSKALLAVSGASQAELSREYKRHGDLGAAGFDLLSTRATERTRPPTLQNIAEAFTAMAAARTTAARASLVEGLLQRASPLEAKYLLKLMVGDMRIGVKQSLIEEAIAAAAQVAVAAVRNAVMLEADLSAATERAFAGTLAEARMRLFHPLGFMLASPVDSPEEAVERFAAKPHEGDEPEHVAAFLEDKYDGMRAQIHCSDASQPGRVAIYSRNREDVTESFPELQEAFSRVSEHAGALIFDGEILGWDFDTARALPFAVLATRLRRKRVSNELRAQVPVVFMAFDLMFAESALLLERPLKERRNRLESVVEKLTGHATASIIVDERARNAQAVLFAGEESAALSRLLLAPSRLVQSADEIERAYTDARARANEGVMLKAADSIYQPGRRGLAWLKLKRELATLDVVVTGAEFGHGKRAGILSDYTFAVRAANGELLNVGKAYSGLTDAEIAEMSAWMMAHTLVDEGFFRTVEPLRILEVAFNNIMRSDRHASGFALRFPRILRIRDDKPVSEIDTVERVEEIYQSQVDKPVE
ncbi:ATP-dependent DNA ligase [Edaphobacter acidisoli]|nr:ATP-dependent DNA ligase [Edaphobacter acidisoli]